MAHPSPAVRALSSVIGWTYVLCWTTSCYPQPLLNYRRKTTRGFSIDFALLNVLGLLSYFVHNVTLYWSPLVRAQYARRHPAQPEPTVRLNDIAYAMHGVFITIVVYSQFYPRLWGWNGPGAGLARCGRWTLRLFWGCVVVVLVAALAVVVSPGSEAWQWLDVIIVLGNVKAFLTIVKYGPQVYHNYVRKSTQGLSITMFILDFTGAVLSIIQLVIDSAAAGDWSSVVDNPAKFALGNVTIFFNLLSFYQHYYLYRGAKDDGLPDGKLDDEVEPLLSGPEDRHVQGTA